MKLVTYTPGVAKTTAGNVKIDDSAARAIQAIGNMQGQGLAGVARGIGQVAGIIQHQQEEMDAVNAQAASNEYTKRINELMYNQDNGLMNTKFDGASGITQSFTEQEKKIRQEVYGEYKFHTAKGQMAFNRLADNSAAQRYTMLQRHQYQQAEAYKDVTYNNALQMNAQTAADNYVAADIVDDNIKQAIISTRARLAGQGDEVVQAGERKAVGQIAQQVINRAYANGDDDRAQAYIEKYGAYLDPNQRTQYSKAVHQRVLSNLTRITADTLVAKYGNNTAALYDAIYNRSEGGSGYDGAAAVAWMKEQANSGANWGVNTCTLGVNKALTMGGGIPGNTWAPTNWEDAKKAGMTFTNRSQLQNGDIVYWDSAGDGDASHVGIYDASTGKVYQSGTSGFRAIPLDEYKLIGFARPQGQGMSLEQKDALYYSCLRQISQQKAIRNAYNDQVYDNLDRQLMGLSDAGNTDYATYLAMVDQVCGADPEMRRKGRAAADYWWNSAVKINKASQRTMGVAEMDAVTNMIRDGEFDSVSDMVSFMQSPDHAFTPEQINKAKGLWQQKLTGEGVFKYPQLNAFISSAVAGEKDTQAKKDREIVLRQYAINYINSYREQYHKDPSIEDVQQALAKEYTDKKFVYQSQGVSVEYDPMMLTRKGIVSADIAYDAAGNETGMMRVVYADANNRGRSRVTYVPVRQFAEQMGQQQPGSQWTGSLENSESDTMNSGT